MSRLRRTYPIVLTAFLFVLAGIGLVYGASRNSNANGRWLTNGTWNGAVALDPNDTVSITHNILFNDPNQPALLTVQKLTIMDGGQVFTDPMTTGQTIRVGSNGAGVGAVDIGDGGSLIINAGDTLELDITDDDANDKINVQSGGSLSITGRLLAMGELTSAITGGDVLTADFTIHDANADFPISFPSGSVVRFDSGRAATWWYAVTGANTATSITLDYDSFGNMEATEVTQRPATYYPTDLAQFRTPGVGDRYEVFLPAKVTVPSSLSPDVHDHFPISIADGATFHFKYAILEYVLSVSFASGLDWTGTEEGGVWDYVSLGPVCRDSVTAVIPITGNSNIQFTNSLVRDAQAGIATEICIDATGGDTTLDTAAVGDDVINGLTIEVGPNFLCESTAANDDVQSIPVGDSGGDPNDCHGFVFNGGAVTTGVVKGTQVARMNDDAFLFNTPSVVYTTTDMLLEDNVTHSIPRQAFGTSSQSIEAPGVKNLRINRHVAYDIQDDLIQLGSHASFPATNNYVTNSFLVNSRQGGGIVGSSATFDEIDGIGVVNNFIGWTYASAVSHQQNIIGNYIVTEAIAAGNSAGIRSPWTARGNVIFGGETNPARQGVRISNLDTHPADVLVESNLVVGQGGTGLNVDNISTNAPTTVILQHNTIDGSWSTVQNAYCIFDQRVAGTFETTARSNVCMGWNTNGGIRGQAAGTNMVSDYNIGRGYGLDTSFVFNISDGANDVTTNVDVLGPSALNYIPGPNSEARLNLNHDGTRPRGLIWAGFFPDRIPIVSLRRGYNLRYTENNVVGCDGDADPPLLDGCDADGDGIIRLWDNCEFVPNPSQIDSDNDAAGDACDG